MGDVFLEKHKMPNLISKRILEQQYCFLEIDSIKVLSEGINSKNYLIFSNNKKYVLKIVNQQISSSRNLEKICTLISFCNENNVPTPKVFRNNDDKFVNKQYNSYLTNFVLGNYYTQKNMQMKNLAVEIAYLHKILKKYNITITSSSKRIYNILSYNELKQIKEKIKNKNQPNHIDRLIIKNFRMLENYIRDTPTNKFKKLPQLIHGDLHQKNILFQNNKISSILDFNAVRYGDKLEDVAFTSYRFSINNKTIKKVANSIMNFIETYSENNYISTKKKNEIHYLFLEEILRRISFILRNYFLYKNKSWIKDLPKFFNYLKIYSDLQYFFP